MVYTITFNPALDYVLRVEDFKEGAVNRSFEEKLLAGGKGINVSQVLTELFVENTALGFIGGFTGEKIERLLKEKGINCDFVKISGESRINVKLKAEKETEVNAKGPEISEKDIESLFEKLKNVGDNDFVVLSGSIPKAVDESIYCKIAERIKGRLVVDAEKSLLIDTLKYKPFLVKPNHVELGEMFGVAINTPDDAIIYANKLVDMGAENVFVSMAEKGGVFVNKSENIVAKAPKGKVINSTGAGDSSVAGFIAGFCKTHNFEKAFKLGICAGSASAFSEKLSSKDEILRLAKLEGIIMN